MKYVLLPIMCLVMAFSPAKEHEDSWIDLKAIEPAMQQVEQYFQDFSTLQANFRQTDPGMGDVSRGTFEISRPAKARFDYKSPVKRVMIINEGKVTYYDGELDQVSYTNVKHSPIDMLLRSDKPLRHFADVVAFNEDNTAYHVTLKPKEKFIEGDDMAQNNTISLVVQKSPLQLVRIARRDSNKRTTVITLDDVTLNKKIKDKRFYYKK